MTFEAAGAPSVVDLFCGAGGLSDGFVQAGLEPVLGVDLDPHSAGTYARNHPDAKVLVSDIAKIDADLVLRTTRLREIDVVAGGPSCQGYSTHGKRIEDDPRNFLFHHFVRLVDELRPKVFLMENVKGLLAFRNGYFRRLIENSFHAIGYRICTIIVGAADYGVPQLRQRVVFFGTRFGGPLLQPEQTHCPKAEKSVLKPYVTVAQAIGDLPLLNGMMDRDLWNYANKPECDYQKYARCHSASDLVTLHQANRLSESARELVRLIPEGRGLRHIDPDLLPDRFKKMRKIKDGSLRKDCTTLYYRIARNRPAYTITCYFRNVASGPFVHPVEDRSLSYREAARLMSFRDGYVFQGAMLARQIGNAVPPLLGKALGLNLLRTLNNTSRPRLRTKVERKSQ